MHHIRSGGSYQWLFSGTAPSSASFPLSRRHSRFAHSAAPSGLGVADPASEPSFLFQFLDVNDLSTDKNSGRAR